MVFAKLQVLGNKIIKCFVNSKRGNNLAQQDKQKVKAVNFNWLQQTKNEKRISGKKSGKQRN